MRGRAWCRLEVREVEVELEVDLLDVPVVQDVFDVLLLRQLEVDGVGVRSTKRFAGELLGLPLSGLSVTLDARLAGAADRAAVTVTVTTGWG